MTDDAARRDRLDRLRDFNYVAMSGWGTTRPFPDERGQKFDAFLKSGEFSKSGLADVASALMENIRRLHSHARIPDAIFNYGRRYQQLYESICRKYGKTSEDLGVPRMGNEPIGGHDENVHRELMEWVLSGGDNILGIPIMPTSSNIHVAGFAAMEWRESVAQIESLCGSLVIESWTMFESLSEDLWEAALNFHPTVLGELRGKAKLSFDELQQNSFDVLHKMGTILKRKEPIGFRSIYEIRDSYRLAFKDQFASIEEILCDKGLQYAAAVRNLLIHKRGIIDKEFEEQTAGIPDVPAFIPNGPPVVFRLTGEKCRELTDSCRVTACWLVNAVHAWIIGHPENLPTPLDRENYGESTPESSPPAPS